VPGVLAVDRDREVLEAVDDSLSGHGYQVRLACSIEQGVQSLATATFDCVLLEEELEQASDGRLWAELSRYPAQTVSLIVLSKRADDSRLAALRRGAFDCLAKPFDPDLLRVLVARAIERTTLARTTRELLEELDVANAELRSSREQLQSRVEEATRNLRTKLEELDRARRELEAARQQRDEFINVIAHELGGPLTAVEGYAEMLGQYEVPAELHRRASIIIRSEIRRLARLVQDLSSPAQSPDQLSLQIGEHDLVELVQEQLEVARAFAPARRILADLPAGRVGIRCDRDRVGQVIFNLLSNAVKYCRGRQIRVWLRADCAAAELRVANDGPGIPPDRLEAIFEPHVRLVEAGSDQPAGRGLGLYVARRMAEVHGGSLRAESTGHGARFVLRLPLAQPLPAHRRRLRRSA
jgi:signal transduction histidine kinase